MGTQLCARVNVHYACAFARGERRQVVHRTHLSYVSSASARVAARLLPKLRSVPWTHLGSCRNPGLVSPELVSPTSGPLFVVSSQAIARHSTVGMQGAMVDLFLLSRCDVIVRAGKTNSLFTALANGLRSNPLAPVYVDLLHTKEGALNAGRR